MRKVEPGTWLHETTVTRASSSRPDRGATPRGRLAERAPTARRSSGADGGRRGLLGYVFVGEPRARQRLRRRRGAPADDGRLVDGAGARERALFDETQRNARESSALSEVGRDLSSTLDLATVMDRIAGHAKELLGAQNSAIFCPTRRPDATAPSSPGRPRRGAEGGDHRTRPGHHRQPAAERPRRTTSTARPPTRGGADPGAPDPQRRAPDGRAAARRRAEVLGAMAVVAQRRQPFVRATSPSSKACRAQATIALQNARLFDETRAALEATDRRAPTCCRSSAARWVDAQPVFEKVLDAASASSAPTRWASAWCATG